MRSSQAIVESRGRPNTHETRPSAKKFFDRRMLRPVTPVSATASLVSCSIGASSTV